MENLRPLFLKKKLFFLEVHKGPQQSNVPEIGQNV